MLPRQAAFRTDYRQRISPAYVGWLHVALIFGLGGRGDLGLRAPGHGAGLV